MCVDWKAGLVGKKHIQSYNTFIWFSDDFKFAFIVFYFICMGHFYVCCRKPTLGKHEKIRFRNSQRPKLIKQLKY